MKLSEIKSNQSDKLHILSYNYDEKQYFSQETVSQSFNSKDKIHKLLIEINDNQYEILLSNFVNNERYMAQEDEFINENNEIENLTTLEISNITQRINLFSKINNNINSKQVIAEELLNFVNNLVDKATEYNIGLHYHKHINQEDEWGNIISDKKSQTIATWNHFDNFILESERINFLHYMAANNEGNQKEANQILQNVDKNIEEKINNLIKEYKINEELIFEEKENIGINPYEEHEDHKYNKTILDLNEKSSKIDNKISEITCVKALLIYRHNSIEEQEEFFDKDILAKIHDYGFLKASERFKGMKDFLKLQIDLKDTPDEFKKVINNQNKINNKRKRKNNLK